MTKARRQCQGSQSARAPQRTAQRLAQQETGWDPPRGLPPQLQGCPVPTPWEHAEMWVWHHCAPAYPPCRHRDNAQISRRTLNTPAAQGLLKNLKTPTFTHFFQSFITLKPLQNRCDFSIRQSEMLLCGTSEITS